MANLLKYNRHWEKGFKYPFPKKRKIFDLLCQSLEYKQIKELIGLRRTGKTTLLFQIINHLVEAGTDPFHIWYFTFDEEKTALSSLIEDFSRQTQIDHKNEKIVIILDEIQKLKGFQDQLKVYYDLYPNVQFIISGSISTFIRKKSQESLAGRVSTYTIHPLDFGEFLYFRDKTDVLEKKEIFKSEIEKEFELYLQSQLIESIFITGADRRKEYFISIIKKIVYEDIPQVFPVANPELLWVIVKIVSQNPGMLFDYYDVSREIGISNKTLSSYMHFLEEAFLVRKVYNFSKNMMTSEKKLKKFYLASPSFCWSITDFIDPGKLVENFVVSIKNHRFFWRDSYKHEIDFVSIEKEKAVPIEVKYKDKIREKELKNFLLFAKRFNAEQGILYNRNIEETKRVIDGFEIKQLPVYFINA